MICRIWRGWATSDRAADYEALLRGTIIPGIEARAIPGFRHIDMMRDLVAIEKFVGEDAEVAHVPVAARAVLARFDERAVHYEVFDRRSRCVAGEGE
jgi:hypothetical protein